MDATYERILDTIDEKPKWQRDLARRVLICIAYSRSPIPLSLLRYIVSVEGESESSETLEYSIPTEAAIIGACANLITIDRNTQLVYFVHFSVQEFLTSDRRKGIETLEIGYEFGHREIARMFITLSLILYAQPLGERRGIDKCREYLNILNEWPHHLLAANLNSLPRGHHLITLTSSFFAKSPPVSVKWSTEVTTYFSFSPSALALIFHLPGAHLHYHPYALTRVSLEQRHLLSVHGIEEYMVIFKDGPAMHYATSGLNSIPVAQRLYSHGYPINYSHGSTQGVFQYSTPSTLTRLPAMCELTPLFSVTDAKIAEFLLDNGASLEPQVVGGKFMDPLVFFASKGNIEVTQLLLDRVVDRREVRYAEALSAVIGDRTKGDVIELLLKKGANPNAQHKIYGHVLQAAAYFGNVEAMQLLLEKGADLSIQGGYYGNALQAAVYCGNFEAMRLLLDQGANVNAQGGHYGNALQAAVDHGSVEVIQLLLDRGADVDAEGGEYGNALQTAIHWGQVETIGLLLDKGADVNARGGYYGNALQATANHDEVECMRLLLDKGANVNAQGGHYGNALQAATYNGNIEAMGLLLDKGADVNAQGGQYGNALQAAACCGNVEAIGLLLAKGADVNVRGGQYGSPLQAAASRGQVKAMRLLLDKGADVNGQCGEYGNALQTAAYMDQVKAMRLLLDKGANVNAQGGYYGSALQAAAYNGNVGVMRFLLDKGADANTQCGYYGNALQAAASWGQFGQTEAMRLLLDRGADVNAQGGKYGNALQAATYRGHVKAMRLLLENGADINAQGGCYGSALRAAEEGGQTEATQLLQREGVVTRSNSQLRRPGMRRTSDIS